MQKLALLLACLACAVHANRLRTLTQRLENNVDLETSKLKTLDTRSNVQSVAEERQGDRQARAKSVAKQSAALAVLLLALNPDASFNPSASVLGSRVVMGKKRHEDLVKYGRVLSTWMQTATAEEPVVPTRVSAPRLIKDSDTMGADAGLKLLNSLTNQKEPFVPIDPRLVKWYICGPTVYDVAHVGHARNYVAFDIVRRVLMEYFGFDILYVMNITDIDDKIILRMHLNHLKAMVALVREYLDSSAADQDEKLAKLREAQSSAESTLALPKPGLADLLTAQGSLADAAAAVGLDGVAVCDVQKAFLELTTAYELDFFADMEALGVMPPDAITRVSDYVDEVIAYIERIMENGFCYEAGGSVYFDTAAFSSDPSKRYGKLDPSKIVAAQVGSEASADWTEGKTTAQLLAEAEGELSAGLESEKRQQADFVLWKASKEGEPAWDSPWGRGRPGWHIECSTMASDLLGDQVDLNSGGVDLKFPHHENQIAQAEAHFNCCEGTSWVNYFLHSGHLQIEGLKMSKSLKNFITIKGALSEYSPSQIRFLFLMRGFSEPMEYSQNSMSSAVDLERRFSSFSTSLGARLKECEAATTVPAAVTDAGMLGEDAPVPPLPDVAAQHKWGEEERALQSEFAARRDDVHRALCDSIDTATALKALEQLVRATNVFMGDVPDVSRGGTLLGSISRYFSRIMNAFGVASLVVGTGAGSSGTGVSAGDTASTPEVADALSQFRDALRLKAIETIKDGGSGPGAAELSKEILSMCDSLRDEALPALGIQIDDRASGVAQVTLGDPKVMMAEAKRKADEAAAQLALKAEKAAAKAAAAAKEAERAKVPPLEMFDPKHDELFDRELSYGALDEDGIPSEDAAGEALSKSARKKLKKQQDRHKKFYASAQAADS